MGGEGKEEGGTWVEKEEGREGEKQGGEGGGEREGGGAGGHGMETNVSARASLNVEVKTNTPVSSPCPL